MKTYFEYKEKTIRIANESSGEDRFTQEQIVEALEIGLAVFDGKFITYTPLNGKIMGVVEDKLVV